MKALSVKQPWAWAILFAGKDVENRVWRTHYRGPLVIHASAQRADAELPRGVRPPANEDAPVSAILGVVDLVDVVEESSSRWFVGPFGWVLENPRRLAKPIPCAGALKLWDVEGDLLRAVRRGLEPETPRPPRYFTQLWTGAEFHFHEDETPTRPLMHAGSDRFLARGMRPGDVLFVWSVIAGRLMLLGRITIGEILDLTSAVKRLKDTSLIDLRDHIIARDPQPKRFDCEVPRELIRELRFVSKSDPEVKWNRRGEPDPQSFRGVRELTAASANALDRLLATARV